MGQRTFAGAAAATTLSAGITSGDTTISVAAGSTWPTGSASYVIDRGLAGEEKILATRSGNTLTATRGYDGTTASAHSSGAAIEHCLTAVDLQEANDHIQATTGHGATGAVVGTTNTQTLTNKTLTAPVLTAPVIADFTSAQHDHGDADDGGALASTYKGVKAYKSAVQAIPTSTDTALTWNLEVFDTNTFHDSSNNTSRLTVPAGLGGKYLVDCVVVMPVAASGVATLNIYKNGDNLTFLAADSRPFDSAAGAYPSINTVLDLSAGDYIEAFLFQSSGTSKNTGSVWQVNHFGMTFLGT